MGAEDRTSRLSADAPSLPALPRQCEVRSSATVRGSDLCSLHSVLAVFATGIRKTRCHPRGYTHGR